MLTMIAETMLPEAFEQGGSIIGLSTLAGFLVTLLVKVIYPIRLDALPGGRALIRTELRRLGPMRREEKLAHIARGSLVVMAGLLAMGPSSLAAEGTWATRADMPTSRWSLSTSVVDGMIYAIGGGRIYGRGALRTVEAYDPAADTWTWKTDIPRARVGMGIGVVNGRIYVIGGIPRLWGEAISTVQQYDPATDTWTTKANMPTARFQVSSSVVDGKIYVIGGSLTNRGTPFTTVEQYDPETDTWTSKADMPTARISASASTVNGKIYVIGGAPGESELYRGLSTVEEYDPATDTWTPKADMPTARTYLSTSVVNGRVYAIGGQDDGILFSTVEAYDPATDTWTPEAGMPTARFLPSTSVVNGKIYAMGGAIATGPVVTSIVEAYDPYPLIVDFNGDGIVDSADVSLMIDYWGTDEPLYDIGPMPWGDGVVDVQDLIVLAEHLFEEFPPFEPGE